VGGPAQPAEPAQPDHWVRDIELSAVRGEIGKPFSAEVTYDTNYLREPEWSVTGLPPGLKFDPAKRTIGGVPTAAGFFTVNVAVRKVAPRDKATHRPQPDERWWPATFQIEVYKPPE
jgi:hypothetical protein